MTNYFLSGRNKLLNSKEDLRYNKEFWLEQIEYCKNGYTRNGERINGYYYFFLNFYKIERLDKGKNVCMWYPDYNLVDREVFDYIEIAFKEGKNLMLITGRGMGKSYIASSIIAHSYSFDKNSYNVVSASINKHADKLFLKVKEGLNELPQALSHNRIKDTDDLIISGIKYKDEFNMERIKGYKSKIEKIVFGNEAGKVRGGRPKFVIMEEVGSWTGSARLIDCYSATEASLCRGTVRTGMSILIGTGGEMHTGGSKDAREMFYNAEAFNLLTFDYNNKKVAYFIPSYRKLEGCYDETGVNDEAKAKAFLEKRREQKLQVSIEQYEKEIQEFPFTPEEAFRVNTISPFAILRSRLETLLLGKDYKNLIKRGDLMMTGNKLSDGMPEIQFIENKKGKFQILEFPVWCKEDNTMQARYTKEIKEKVLTSSKNLYISGCDSYDQDKSFTSNSNGSIFVFKRMNNIDESGGLFVAQYTDRPDSVEEFYYNTLLLNLFYRSKMLVEHTKISIINYYKNKKYYHLLWEAPKLNLPDMKYSKAVNKVGYLMSERHKKFALEKYISYVRDNIDKFYFIDQVEDHLNFNLEGNEFDRTIASMLCIIQDNEMTDTAINAEQESSLRLPYWQRDEFGNIVFK